MMAVLHFILTHWLMVLSGCLTLASIGYLLFVIVLSWRFCDESEHSLRCSLTSPSVSGVWPGISQIKPCYRVDDAAVERLRTFIEQDYPGVHEMILASSECDPLLSGLSKQYPQGTARSAEVICSQGSLGGPNRKIGVCAAAQELASQDIIVISDDDMVCDDRLMRRIASAFSDPSVGVATSLYIVREVRGLGDVLEGISICDFAASVLAARRTEGLTYAFGAVMAIRRQALDSFGGLKNLRQYLADDYQLGHKASHNGWKVALLPGVVEDCLPGLSLGSYWSHQLRWMRTCRVSRPGGFFAFLITQGTLWSFLWACCCGFSPWGWGVLLVWLLLRLHWCVAMWKLFARLSGREPGKAGGIYRWGCLAPLKDVFYFLMWVMAFAGNRVAWGNAHFAVQRDGTMLEVK